MVDKQQYQEYPEGYLYMAPSILRICKLVKVKQGKKRVSYIASGTDDTIEDANNNVSKNE